MNTTTTTAGVATVVSGLASTASSMASVFLYGGIVIALIIVGMLAYAFLGGGRRQSSSAPSLPNAPVSAIWIEGPLVKTFPLTPTKMPDIYVYGDKSGETYIVVAVAPPLAGPGGRKVYVAMGTGLSGRNRLGLTVEPRDLLMDTALDVVTGRGPNLGFRVAFGGKGGTDNVPVSDINMAELAAAVAELFSSGRTTAVRPVIGGLHVGISVAPSALMRTISAIFESYTASSINKLTPLLATLAKTGRVKTGGMPWWAQILLIGFLIFAVIMLAMSAIHPH